MNYLSFENISKSYGDNILFLEISLNINKGQKVALIAKNGSGKTSLLNILAGEEEPEGENRRILVHPDVRIGYLRQEPNFEEDRTVLESALHTDNPQINAIREYELANESGDNPRIHKAIEQMERLKAWDVEARVKEVLDRLAIGDFEKKVGLLSGGQKKRLALARMLIDQPDFIILDEPTNHLDLPMIEWLEEYLKQPNLTLLLVTHDRYFLERVCDTIVELDNASLYKYQGSYSAYLEKKTERQENEAVRFDKNKKLLKTELEWVRRQPKARGTKAKSRVGKFEELREEVRGVETEREMQIVLKPERLGSKIVELQYISHSFGDLKILDDFHYKFRKKDRVGIVGPNGSGKTTMLDIITGSIRPDSGKVVVGETVSFGYYTQSGMQLDDDMRVIDVIREIAEYVPLSDGSKMSAPQLLERFMFSRPKQQVYVSKLSGGEKRRLYLLTVLVKNPNFLILDEPTNDLDIFTLNVLEDYLLDYPGCLAVVSHDRFFMDKLVDHLFVFEGEGRIRDFPGNYSQYREFSEEQLTEARAEGTATRKKGVAPPVSGLSNKQERRVLQNKVRKLERRIEELERQKTEIEEKFTSGPLPPGEIRELSIRLDAVREELGEKEREWEEAVEELTVDS